MKQTGIFLLTLLHYCCIIAQTPYYYTLNEESGLPSNEVYQITQDKFGLIWIGTNEGLFSYDGVKFKSYPTNIGNSRSISEIRIDKNNKLWCQNFSGQIFSLLSNSLTLFIDYSNQLKSFPSFCPDDEGGIWVAAEKCVEHINSNGELLKRYYKINQLKDTVFWYDIEKTDNKNIFVSSFNNGINLLNENQKEFEVIDPQIGLSSRIQLDKVGNQLFVIVEKIAGHKYQIFNFQNKEFKHLADSENDLFIYKINVGNDGKIWVCTSKGVYPFNYKNIISDSKNNLFKDDKISSFYMDKENNYWFSSLQNGIHIIPNMSVINFSKEQLINNDSYFSALTKTSQNELLMGTYSGLVYQLTNNKLKLLFNNLNGEYRSVKKLQKVGSSIFIARGKFSRINNNIEQEIPNLKNTRDFCIVNDTIFYCSPNSAGFIPLNKSKNITTSFNFILHSKSSRSITFDSSSNTIFFVSIDGLFSYKAGKLKKLTYNQKTIHANKVIYNQKNLWVATTNEGLFYVDKFGAIKRSDLNNLIKGKQIKTLKANGSILWIATEKCLNKINIIKNDAEFFDLTDGLNTKEINDIEISIDTIYLATNKGIISFPANIKALNNTKPGIKIISMEVNNEKFEFKNVISLKRNQNKIKFDFLSCCIRARGNFNYAYRLLGIDSNWTQVKSVNNEILFPSLPSGSYTFEVKSINEDGIESVNIANQHFVINKGFWETWWFFGLISLVIIALTFFISIITIRNVQRKAQAKNDLISSQLTAIRAQMNPHFLYNTLNSIQDLILKSDIKNTNYYLSKFSSLMRKILEFSENEKVLLSEEIEMLNDYLELEKLRFGQDFKYELILLNSFKPENIFIPSLIIQPFIENAIKHGLLHKKGEKCLSIKFSLGNKQLYILIEDNGVGRKRSAQIQSRNKLQHKSFATSAVQKRVELLNSKGLNIISFKISDLNPNLEYSGTKVEIIITL